MLASSCKLRFWHVLHGLDRKGKLSKLECKADFEECLFFKNWKHQFSRGFICVKMKKYQLNIASVTKYGLYRAYREWESPILFAMAMLIFFYQNHAQFCEAIMKTDWALCWYFGTIHFSLNTVTQCIISPWMGLPPYGRPWILSHLLLPLCPLTASLKPACLEK